MEQRTMGRLITALRKAGGMTQKDVAERLGVSDKTVSRWERDEGTPDLSVLPALAELFGVTCDELLRGERRPPELQGETEVPCRGEKQRRHLLKAALAQYRSRVFIAMGLSAAGLIAAEIGNLAFLRGALGFLLGAVFHVASAVCLAIFVNRAFASVEDGELDEAEVSRFKRQVLVLARRCLGLTAALLGVTAPLLLAGAYAGLGIEDSLLLGLAGGAGFLLLHTALWYFLTPVLLRRGVYRLSGREEAVYRRRHRLAGRCAAVLAGVLALTALGHWAATMIWGPWSVMEGTVFHDYASFAAYMEQDLGRDAGDGQTAPPEAAGTWYNARGEEISEEEARRRTIGDEEGRIVCTYLDRNEEVVSIRYGNAEGALLPITVYTYDDLALARRKVRVRHVLFAAAYCAETAAAVLVYRKKAA